MLDTKESKETVSPPSDGASEPVEAGTVDDLDEVFNDKEGGVKFRTVAWPHATAIFLKFIFATGVLSIPASMYQLGAVGGSLSVVAWTGWNQYTAVILSDFRERHGKCHSVADMANVIAGPIGRELMGMLFVIANVICAGSTVIAVSTALNALSMHAACTVWWAFIGFIFIALTASVRKLEKISWLTWAGFISVFVAVFIVVVGVTQVDRPAAAPQTGDYELGFYAFPNPPPTFEIGMIATCNIYVSSANTGAFIPVIAEMKNPKDFKKAAHVTMTLINIFYLTFSLVVYAYCGKWVASPSLGSAGQTIKMVAYGVALIGLVISGCLYTHIAAKYLFVRILRGTPHLQSNTLVHWGTWLGCTFGLCAIGFVIAEAVPIFNYLLAILGSLIYGPLNIIFPAFLWLFDHRHHFKMGLVNQGKYAFHLIFFFIGCFITVGGTYAVCLQIRQAYADGLIGSAFSCADNSNSS